MTAPTTSSPPASLPHPRGRAGRGQPGGVVGGGAARRRPPLALAAATLLLACGKEGPPRPPAAPPAATTADAALDVPAATTADAAGPPPDAPGELAATIDSAFAARAREIAGTYLGWGRVDDELRWAPALCRLPLPGVARMSASTDPATHGRKLYSVFARHHAAYPAGPHTEQVVVKQSWTVEPTDAPYDPERARDHGDAGDHFYPYAVHDGMVFRAGAPAGLYLMWKVDPRTPGTDAGWVYATLTAAGELTAAGRVQSCMDCHTHAKHDRLFGLPPATPRP